MNFRKFPKTCLASVSISSWLTSLRSSVGKSSSCDIKRSELAAASVPIRMSDGFLVGWKNVENSTKFSTKSYFWYFDGNDLSLTIARAFHGRFEFGCWKIWVFQHLLIFFQNSIPSISLSCRGVSVEPTSLSFSNWWVASSGLNCTRRLPVAGSADGLTPEIRTFLKNQEFRDDLPKFWFCSGDEE